MCLSEYLLWKFSKSVQDLVTAPQGDPEELKRAQQLVEEASKALDVVLEKLEAQKQVKKLCMWETSFCLMWQKGHR